MPWPAPWASSPSARRRATTSPTLFAAHAPAGTKVILRGALDGLSDAEVDRLKPENGADTLYTRLRGGRDVKISKKAVIARSPAALAQAARRWLRRAGLCLHRRLPADGGRRERPVPLARAEWPGHGPAAARPAGPADPARRAGREARRRNGRGRGSRSWPRRWRPAPAQGEAAAAAARLAAKKPDLVAMDCMSYTPTTKDWIKGPLGVPALLAITATGRVLREMLD